MDKMCNLGQAWFEEGKEEGKEEGIKTTQLGNIVSLCKKLSVPTKNGFRVRSVWRPETKVLVYQRNNIRIP